MIIGLAGDWHGNGRWACSAVEWFAEQGVSVVEQLGDFGIWPGDWGQRYLDAVQGAAEAAGVTVYVTPGNHEDYSQIDAVEVDAGGVRWIRNRVGLRERGSRWELGGCSFVSLGGAPSIDRWMRVEGVSWWREEMITLEEAERVAAAGYADVMLAHDSPNGGVAAVQAIVTSGGGWSAEALAYAREGRELMDIAFAGVRPRVFAHGHYHVADRVVREGTLFVSLGADGSTGNVALLDLETLKVTR